MCKKAGLVVAFDAQKCLVAHATCDSFMCEECSKRMLDHWKLRAQIGARKILRDGGKLDFVTLTSHEKLKSFDATAHVWTHVWSMSYDAIKRKNADFAYLAIPERHADGRMHVHAIWNGNVNSRWLKDNIRKRGGGYECEAQNVYSMYDIVRYVTKYVTKQFNVEVPVHFRRIRVSQNWPDVPAPDTALSNLEWMHVKNQKQLERVYRECERISVRMIDVRTGDAFDESDACFTSETSCVGAPPLTSEI